MFRLGTSGLTPDCRSQLAYSARSEGGVRSLPGFSLQKSLFLATRAKDKCSSDCILRQLSAAARRAGGRKPSARSPVNEVLFDRTPKAFEAERQRSPSVARKNPRACARIFNLIPSAAFLNPDDHGTEEHVQDFAAAELQWRGYRGDCAHPKSQHIVNATTRAEAYIGNSDATSLERRRIGDPSDAEIQRIVFAHRRRMQRTGGVQLTLGESSCRCRQVLGACRIEATGENGVPL